MALLTTSLSTLLFCLFLFSQGQARNHSLHPRPYTIHIDSDFIETIRSKAAQFDPPGDIDAPPFFDGPPVTDVTTLAEYWATKFDHTAFQHELNENFTHYTTTLPPPGGQYNRSVDLYFIHQRSQRQDATPILMLHGWPSTSQEWAKVIPDLVNPPNSSLPAFHVIAPDLPGFGFSPAPTAPGLGADEHASLMASLMEQLGYDRYIIYSTDLGYRMTQRLIPMHPDRIIHHITDFYFVFPNATDTERYTSGQTTEEETAFIGALNAFLTNHSGYSAIHSTLPLSIAHALNDSPVGFLAWMWQGVYTVHDKAQSAEELIRRALLLFLPGPYGNIRAYKELFQPAFFAGIVTDVPTSVTQWGGTDNYPALASWNLVPRDWVERTANLSFFRRHPVGGHFPADSEPKLWIEDIREIFADAS